MRRSRRAFEGHGFLSIPINDEAEPVTVVGIDRKGIPRPADRNVELLAVDEFRRKPGVDIDDHAIDRRTLGRVRSGSVPVVDVAKTVKRGAPGLLDRRPERAVLIDGQRHILLLSACGAVRCLRFRGCHVDAQESQATQRSLPSPRARLLRGVVGLVDGELYRAGRPAFRPAASDRSVFQLRSHDVAAGRLRKRRAPRPHRLPCEGGD